MELQRIGRAFGNCVALPEWHAAQHWCHLIGGTGAYLVSDAPPTGARSALLRGLAAAGVKVVALDPQSALSRLDTEARRGRDDDEDEEGDDPGEAAA